MTTEMKLEIMRYEIEIIEDELQKKKDRLFELSMEEYKEDIRCMIDDMDSYDITLLKEILDEEY